MYNPKEIEKKWQDFWEKNKTFKTYNPWEDGFEDKEKFYVLDMFPYPSGAGLHVGHPEWYTANDILARYKKTKGFNVLHPMWWDAFGLPAENYAIKTGTHPKITTAKNIETFKNQIKSLGFSYDWEREIDTTSPDYYKWTQWIFLKLFEAGLAYEQDLPINYCPSCKTGLANEEVLNDFTCERCWTKVEKRKLRQWVLKITDYAERLLSDVDKLDWPESIKEMQRNWIWKSVWAEFKLEKQWDKEKFIEVYTTRIDTVFWMSYVVIAPDYPKVSDFITEEQKNICLEYIENSAKKSDQDRTADNKEKTWVFSGSYVINPFNNAIVPVWIWDYVLGNYGTWAVMAVPAHDARDFEFAKKYDLEITPTIYPKEIIEKYKEQSDEEFFSALTQEQADEHILETQKLEDKFFDNLPFLSDWFVWNINYSVEKEEDFDKAQTLWQEYFTISSSEAREKFTKYATRNWFWTKKINYKLRDWLFSRQRYWWEPIPLIHLNHDDLRKLPHIYDLSEALSPKLAYIYKRDPEAGENTKWCTCWSWKVRNLVIWGKIFSKIYDWINGKIVCDYRLPLELPEIDSYEPAWDGNSPLARVPDFVEVKLAENLTWKRETNTMPQWWGSCWYYLRYMDNKNPEDLVNKEVENYWDWVDSYVGWAEHAVLHLLYARFWHKFLFDIWVVKTDEPFHKLRNQWLILSYAFERKNWWLVAVDLVEEKDWKFFEISTWEEVNRIISKMSKSLKNVVNPDDIVNEYWADSLRLYEMYMADFKDSAPWDTKWIVWVRRFLEKSERLFTAEEKISTESDDFTMKLLHKTIKKVEEDIENYKFNTAIASLMILVNNWLPKDEVKKTEWKNIFVRILHPFAPHLAEELWERIWEKKSVFFSTWPKYDEKIVVDNEVTIWVQVLWKVRWQIVIWLDEDKDSVLAKAKANSDIAKWLEWKEIVKEIYVPGKILNIVIK